MFHINEKPEVNIYKASSNERVYTSNIGIPGIRKSTSYNKYQIIVMEAEIHNPTTNEPPEIQDQMAVHISDYANDTLGLEITNVSFTRHNLILNFNQTQKTVRHFERLLDQKVKIMFGSLVKVVEYEIRAFANRGVTIIIMELVPSSEECFSGLFTGNVKLFDANIPLNHAFLLPLIPQCNRYLKEIGENNRNFIEEMRHVSSITKIYIQDEKLEIDIDGIYANDLHVHIPNLINTLLTSLRKHVSENIVFRSNFGNESDLWDNILPMH